MSDEIDALIEENRRLRRDVRLLGERLDAIERSRWWRLHPRFLLERESRGEAHRPDVPPVIPDQAPPHDETVATRFAEQVVARGAFSGDFFTHHIPSLDPLVDPLAGKAASILEIGSYEGLSTCFFLWRLPDASLTCIDHFAGTLEGDSSGAGLEERFDRNVELVDAARVRKLVGDSRRLLLDLVEDQRPLFDLIYVDGSHFALDVIVDAAFSWRLLAKGGTMNFDDYAWNNLGDDPVLRPGPAIDAVLEILEGKYELLDKGAQLALRKTSGAGRPTG